MRFYKSNYGWFKKFTDECNIEMIEEVDNYVIEKYTLHLKERLNNPISINTYLRAVRSFLYYCMDNNMLERFKIKLLKADKKPKETYSTEQLNRLLAKPEKGFKNFPELRDWTISSFLIGTGIRASTLIYESKQFSEALARLLYTCQRRTLAVITGEVGAGKSTLLHMLGDKVDPNNFFFIYLADSNLTSKNFISMKKSVD